MILPRISAGFDGDKTIAALAVRKDAAATGEIRVKRRTVPINAMTVAPRRIGLPDSHPRPRNRAPVFIQNAPAHHDAFSRSFAVVLVCQVMIVRADSTVAENRAGEFTQRMRQQNERLFGVTLTCGDVRGVEIIRLRSRPRSPITQYFAHKRRKNDCNWRGSQRSSIRSYWGPPGGPEALS